MSDVGKLIERVLQLESTLPPENQAAPVVSGIPQVGGTLSCTVGDWNCMSMQGATYAYLWSGTGTPADGPTYEVPAGDSGVSLTCTVTAANPNGTLGVASNAVEIPGEPVVPVNGGTTATATATAPKTTATTSSTTSRTTASR